MSESDSRVVGGYAKIARHRKLCATAVGVAVEARDDRDRQLGYAVERRAHRTRHLGRAFLRAHVLELLEVATGAEGTLTRAADDEHAGAGLVNRAERLVELTHRSCGEGIASLRPVDQQSRHLPVDLEPQVRHYPPPFRGRSGDGRD